MPMMNAGIWCQVVNDSYWLRQELPGPVVVLVTRLWSAVMPACASAMIAVPSAANRSALVRPMLARRRARYVRITCTNCVALRGDVVGYQDVGRGKPAPAF